VGVILPSALVEAVPLQGTSLLSSFVFFLFCFNEFLVVAANFYPLLSTDYY
jgi:hypothetical protein